MIGLTMAEAAVKCNCLASL